MPHSGQVLHVWVIQEAEQWWEKRGCGVRCLDQFLAPSLHFCVAFGKISKSVSSYPISSTERIESPLRAYCEDEMR